MSRNSRDSPRCSLVFCEQARVRMGRSGRCRECYIEMDDFGKECNGDCQQILKTDQKPCCLWESLTVWAHMAGTKWIKTRFGDNNPAPQHDQSHSPVFSPPTRTPNDDDKKSVGSVTVTNQYLTLLQQIMHSEKNVKIHWESGNSWSMYRGRKCCKNGGFGAVAMVTINMNLETSVDRAMGFYNPVLIEPLGSPG